MPQPGMMILIFIFAVMSCTVHAFIQTSSHYPLMHYTRLISEEHFDDGPPLVIVLPLAEENTTKEEFGYLIEELHKTGRWPILAYNMSSNMNGNMYSDTNKHGAYIILVPAPCNNWEEYISHFQQKVNELSAGNLTRHSFNPRAKFMVSVISNCGHNENTEISRSILKELWFNGVMKAIVLFLKLNEEIGIDLHGNITDSVQNTYMEIHTWSHYESSLECNPNDITVPVKVFTVRNFKVIKRNDIFHEYYNKNYQKCPIRVEVDTAPPFVNPPKRVWKNDSGYQDVYDSGWEIELLGIVGNTLNMSLDIKGDSETFDRVNPPAVYFGGVHTIELKTYGVMRPTRGYDTFSYVWYTPCALKYQRWTRFFNIFSADVWVCFALSLVFAVITVILIANNVQKSKFHEDRSYSNISSAATNVIAVSLSVSVNKQPRSSSLRLFFLCWISYSVAISTVFQAYFTSFLIEPVYEEPIRTVNEMLETKRKFGFFHGYESLFDTSDYTESAIVKNAVSCSSVDECFIWATVYHNISIILDDRDVGYFHEVGKWSDEYKRPLLCTLEDGVVKIFWVVYFVRKGGNLKERINHIIVRLDEGGIITHIKKPSLGKGEAQSKYNSANFAESYTAIRIRHLQTPFYLLLLGYVLAFSCFVIESLWHHYRSKRRVTNSTSLCNRQALM